MAFSGRGEYVCVYLFEISYDDFPIFSLYFLFCIERIFMNLYVL